MLNEQVDILAFGAHPDDVELSASGTLLKHKAMGYSTAIVDLTEGELGTRGTVETRYAEAAASSKILGLSARENLKMADGFFEHNEQNLRLVIEQIRRFKPRKVFINAPEDRHPDHGKGSKLVGEACFLSGLRKIETNWNGEEQACWRPEAVYHYIQDRNLKPDFIVDVSDFVEEKIKSILAFSTQFYNPESIEPETPISSASFLDFIKGRMSEMGRPVGVKYGEGFITQRKILVKDIMDLF